MNDFRITVWGLGKHARTRIIPALSFLKEFSLVGVCSRTEKVVKACAEELDCDGWIDPEIMLGSNKVDIVYISTPIGVHFKLAKMALEARKHVWCEKPLTCNYNHTKKLIDLAEKNKKMLTEAFMFLYHPQFIKIQNLIKNKELGDVHSVVCRFGIPTLDEPGFRNSAELCGGALWDIASYPVAAVLELFYDQNVQVLFSEVRKHENFPVDTTGRAILRFSQGTTAYLEWGVGVGYKNEIDLWTDKGSFFTDKIFSKPENYQPVYRIRNKYGEESLVDGQKSEQFIQMFREFLNISKSSKRIKDEHQRILERARVMDEIVKFSI